MLESDFGKTYMIERVGLSNSSKKLFEFKKFDKKLPVTAALYTQSKSFFRSFEITFKKGYKSIILEGQVFDQPNLEDVNVSLVLFHFAVELILKAFLSLENGRLLNEHEHHNIKELLSMVVQRYSGMDCLLKEDKYRLIFDELTVHFDGIRYMEGTLCVRHNHEKGWKNKKPLQELSDALYLVYKVLIKRFEQEIKS